MYNFIKYTVVQNSVVKRKVFSTDVVLTSFEIMKNYNRTVLSSLSLGDSLRKWHEKKAFAEIVYLLSTSLFIIFLVHIRKG